MPMKQHKDQLKLGVIGCGAIGSRIALSTKKELKGRFVLSAVYDIDVTRSEGLAKKLRAPQVVKSSVDELVRSADVVAECVNTDATTLIVNKVLKAKKHVLVMSVGRLLKKSSLFSLAEKNRSSILIPSGAIAGLDAVKAASLSGNISVTLTSCKPPSGFVRNPYLRSRGIDLESIVKPAVLFDGEVSEAVKWFPRNINVAAALKFACGKDVELRVRIIADPKVERNTHEITLEGACGRVTTRTENTICPDNPKTSYLAVLSGIQALKQFYQTVKIGT